MVDRVLAGLRDQGPGAIPALILSLLALGGTVYWLLSRDDERRTQTVEVVGAPAPLTTTQAARSAPVDRGSESASGTEERRPGAGGQDGGPPTTAVPPPPPSSSGGPEIAPPVEQVGSANGGERPRGAGPPSLDDIQRLLRGGDRTAGGNDNALPQSLRDLLLR